MSDDQQVLSLVAKLHPSAILTTPERGESIRSQLGETPFDPPVVTFVLLQEGPGYRMNGVLAHLVKPVSQETLMAAIRPLDTGGELTILIVDDDDDDPDTVRLLATLLTTLPRPYRILKAYDGEEALKVMEDVVPDVVLLDLLMPGLSGEQMLERMRGDPRRLAVPAIIVSAADQLDQPLALGMLVSVWRRRRT